MAGFASTRGKKTAELQGQQCLLRNAVKLLVWKLQTLFPDTVVLQCSPVGNG